LFLERATNVDITKELPTVISFCSGYGGIERGLDIAGLEHRVIAYVEIEAFAIANLVNKMEDGIIPPAPIYTDLKTFPAEIFRGRTDIITGGYPCQPFSAAGQRKGTEDPRHLWPYIRKHVQTIGPSRCFFENVEGHISLGLSSVISDLEEDGYRSAWGIFSAREVGAPHQRKRVYILADSHSIRRNWWKLPDTASQRPVEIETQQRPEQPVVRSEAKGCSGDSGKNELADSKSIGTQRLRPSGAEKPYSHGQAELSLRQSK
jgi:site-specific DNA-cytosine methylase